MSLSVGDALQEGWTTFRRMPWTFVFFSSLPSCSPQWWTVLELLAMQLVIILLGLIAFGFGLLAAIPVVACSTASACRQLFGVDDSSFLLTYR